MIRLTEKERDFLWSLLPDWVKNDEPGLCSTFYGTGSYEGDKKVTAKVKEILKSG